MAETGSVISDLKGDIQIVVFRNDKKANDNQPDYNILLSEPKDKEEIAPSIPQS